jgi:glucose-6-phosphate isomerase
MGIEMILDNLENKVQFLTDNKGKRTHAVLPIRQYLELLEDLFDNTIADSREKEGTIKSEELTKRLQNAE